MIKQIPSKEIKEYLKKNPKCVLLDVRTSEEWDMFGRPNGKELGLKTYFLTIQDDNFINDFKKLSINKDQEILFWKTCSLTLRAGFLFFIWAIWALRFIKIPIFAINQMIFIILGF